MATRPLMPLAAAVIGLAMLADPAYAQDDAVAARPAASAPVYRAALSYEHTRFARDLDPWHLTSLELSRRSGGGTLILRGTTARRFGTNGTQVEVDAYPRLGQGVYGYLNAGYSGTELFPEWRYGAELFVTVGQGVELSAGGRRLEFDAERVDLYTGSAGLYRGNYYLAARSFFSPRTDGTVSASLMARRYLRDAEEYLTLRVGGGSAPADDVTRAELERVSSFRVSVDGRRAVATALHLRLLAGFEREELPLARERSRVTVGAAIERAF